MELGEGELGPLKEAPEDVGHADDVEVAQRPGRCRSIQLHPPRARSLLACRGNWGLAGASLAAALLLVGGARSGLLSRHTSVSQVGLLATESKQIVTEGCHTAIEGEVCYDKIVWAMGEGIKTSPEHYKGLSPESSFVDFQTYFATHQYGECQKPCPGGAAPPKTQPPPPSHAGPEQCLCLFDIDRTLTGKQGLTQNCPANKVIGGVADNAFGGGTLTLSPLGQNVGGTFCGQCLLGIISAGSATGPPEQAVLAQAFPPSGQAGNVWSGPDQVTSPLVVGCANAVKAQCAKRIVDWFASEKGANIPAHEVYFFDDTTGNTNGFADFGFNARQVSCPSREGVIGFCGAELAEIQRKPGIFNCPR